jgi:hypothetical protein
MLLYIRYSHICSLHLLGSAELHALHGPHFQWSIEVYTENEIAIRPTPSTVVHQSGTHSAHASRNNLSLTSGIATDHSLQTPHRPSHPNPSAAETCTSTSHMSLATKQAYPLEFRFICLSASVPQSSLSPLALFATRKPPPPFRPCGISTGESSSSS